MTIQFTARHFKASQELHDFAEEAVRALAHKFDVILSADITIDEHPHGDVRKAVEICLLVSREKLVARDESHSATQSITACVQKLERQLVKYKAKLHSGRHIRPELTTEVESDDDTALDI